MTWIGENSIHWASSIEFDPFDTRSAWVTSGNGVFRTTNLDATPTTWTFAVRGLEETVPLGLVSVPGGPVFIVGDMNTEGVVYMSTVGRGIVYGAPAATP